MSYTKMLLFRHSLMLLMTILSCNETFILRQPCLTYANFSIVVPDAVTPGPLLATLIFTSEGVCKEQCIMNGECNSVNFEREGENTCELSSWRATAAMDYNNLPKRQGWTLMTTDDENKLVGHNCHTLKPCEQDEVCVDSCSCPGYTCHSACSMDASKCSAPDDCDSLRRAGTRKSGIYQFKTDIMTKVVDLYCDMESDDNGWTIIQRRIDNDTDFDRLWYDYKHGFGNLSASFWLGLDNIHVLTTRHQSILRVELIAMQNPNEILFAEYSHFSVGNETSNYSLTVQGYQTQSTLSDSLTTEFWNGRLNHNGQMFSTRDKENDPEERLHCAAKFRGGWWFSQCYTAYLNGLFFDTSIKIDCDNIPIAGRYITWKGIGTCFGEILHVQMKTRYA